MGNFWVIVKSQKNNSIIDQYGAMSEKQAIKLADKIDEESDGTSYTEVVEK